MKKLKEYPKNSFLNQNKTTISKVINYLIIGIGILFLSALVEFGVDTLFQGKVHLMLNPLLFYVISIFGSFGSLWFIMYSIRKENLKFITLSRLQKAFIVISITNVLIIAYFLVGSALNKTYIENGTLSYKDGGLANYYLNDGINFNFFEFHLIHTLRHLFLALFPICFFLVGLHKRNQYLNKRLTADSDSTISIESVSKELNNKWKRTLFIFIKLLLIIIISLFTLLTFLFSLIAYSDHLTFWVF